MSNSLLRLAVVFSLLATTFSRAASFYVDLNSANPTTPYSDWSTAATNIQDAIDASADGDHIWVTNGVYQTGGKVMAGNLTNRVALDKAVTVQSVNGPFATTITGNSSVASSTSVRCAWLTNNAALIGFTLTRGAPRNGGDPVLLESGGGVWCASSNALVSSCIIISNAAYFRGAGAYQGTLNNCFIAGNSDLLNLLAGAAYGGILNNCTVVSNSVIGLASCQATNSICYYNGGNNYSGGGFAHSCVTPAAAGTGNFTNAPLFYPDRIHLALGSPGIAAGTTPVTSADIFGQAWGSPPSVGCAETGGLPYIFPPQVQSTNNPIGFTIKSSAFGDPPFTYAWLKDSAPLQDDGHFSGTQSTNLIATGLSFIDAGSYQLVVGNNSGSVTSAVARVIIHCVDNTGSNPVSPYTSWDTAATNIQDAIDAAAAGEFVLVTNGVYSAGGKVISGDLTNRVAIDKALIVFSVNGYTSTVIEGQWDSTSTNGPGAVRCAWLTDGATLFGFTLRNGATRGGNFISQALQYGGGALLSSNALLSNCVLTNNSARYGGGGVAFGTVNNCFVSNNSAMHGGGAYSSHLNNCTVRQNYYVSGGNGGGGVESCVSRNCVVSENYDSPFNVNVANYPSFTIFEIFTNCCTSPLPSRGTNNMTNAPLFLNFPGGFGLSPASPCRGAGNPLFTTGYDLDGEPYLNPPSIGCDEIITSNLSGPLSFSFLHSGTNTVVYHRIFFATTFEGRASELDWSFGDSTVVTNVGGYISHTWTNTGTYTVTLTAYNLDHPEGVSSNIIVTIDPFLSPTLQVDGVVSNAFQFEFPAQGNIFYQLQYATNLTPPVSWISLPLNYFFSNTGTVVTMRDPAITNDVRFYRVYGQ
jgi:hypothetical protein